VVQRWDERHERPNKNYVEVSIHPLSIKRKRAGNNVS
jgi:hypothetical protein